MDSVATSGQGGASALPERKPFRVDMKWIFGLLFTFALGLTVLFLGFYLLTSKQNVDEIAVPLIDELFGVTEGIEQNYDQILVVASEKPSQDIFLALGIDYPLGMTGTEVARMSSMEFSRFVLDHIGERIWAGEIEHLSLVVELGAIADELVVDVSLLDQSDETPVLQVATDAELQDVVRGVPYLFAVTGFVGTFFTESSHGFILGLMVGALILAGAFGVGLVIYSFRFGKMISFGAAALAAGFWPFLVFRWLKYWLGTVSETELPGARQFEQMVDIVGQTFYYLLIAGLVLFFLGIILGAVLRPRQEKSN
jgi:hypothetical protein